jgi:predicted nucleotide-binding protein
MPYYHVYIEYHKPSENGQRETYELDLGIDGLNEQIVKPYLSGKSFMCGGQPIDAFSVDTITISKTIESASDLIPKLKAEKDRESTKTGIGWGWSTEDLVIEYGVNVTREFITHPPRKESISEKKPTNEKASLSKDVFIVHGKDHESMKELKALLVDLGFNPIVLHEQASGSRTIVEKLEKYSDVGYAFVILTPDDLGCECSPVQKPFMVKTFSQKTALELTPIFLRTFKQRSRQNVILEFGYFIGLLGRDKVCCLYKGNVELPSDMQGIVHIPFNESITKVKDLIMKELREAGYEIKA